MIRVGDNIAFWPWKKLHDKILCYCSENLLACLGITVDGLKQPAPVLLCFLLLILMSMCFPAFSRQDRIKTRAALQALLALVVPTCSLWPSRYIDLASATNSRVYIPLEVIIKDTIDGIIEFRNPIDDLADLIGFGAAVNGHTVCIDIGWKWWVNCFRWWILAKLRLVDNPSESGSRGYILGLFNWLQGNTPTVNSSSLALSLSPSALTSSTSCLLLCLDCLPHGIIPTLDASSMVTLEFTAFSPSLKILSTAQIVSAIPFIISDFSRRQPRSLVSVLKQLTVSYGPNLVIDSISNISADYENALRRVSKSLSEEQGVRDMWAKTLGIKAWRRDKFLVAFEAALVRRGWIERWAVQVTVK